MLKYQQTLVFAHSLPIDLRYRMAQEKTGKSSVNAYLPRELNILPLTQKGDSECEY
jgi:hypothetical protein